jgi:acyl carrier protein
MLSLEAVFAEVFAISESSVSDDLLLKDIANWDSMSHMHLIVRLEENFTIQLTGDQIADMKTVGDARQALKSLGVSV